jgi:hypothetical protein
MVAVEVTRLATQSVEEGGLLLNSNNLEPLLLLPLLMVVAMSLGAL